jgi:hypothetical protein
LWKWFFTGLALQAFKQRLDDPVGALSNWNDSDTTPCNWKGVVCQNLTNVVVFMYAKFYEILKTLICTVHCALESKNDVGCDGGVAATLISRT